MSSPDSPTQRGDEDFFAKRASPALSPLHELDNDTFIYLIETISIRDPASLLRFASASKHYYQRVVGWLRDANPSCNGRSSDRV